MVAAPLVTCVVPTKRGKEEIIFVPPLSLITVLTSVRVAFCAGVGVGVGVGDGVVHTVHGDHSGDIVETGRAKGQVAGGRAVEQGRSRVPTLKPGALGGNSGIKELGTVLSVNYQLFEDRRRGSRDLGLDAEVRQLTHEDLGIGGRHDPQAGGRFGVGHEISQQTAGLNRV